MQYRRLNSAMEKFLTRLPGGNEKSHFPEINLISLRIPPVSTFTLAQAEQIRARTQASLNTRAVASQTRRSIDAPVTGMLLRFLLQVLLCVYPICIAMLSLDR